jgi:hypothetical protein
MTNPPRQYIPRVSIFERQRVRLQRYEHVIRRAEEAGDETTIANVADLRWLWDLANQAPPPRHRERKGLSEISRQEQELGKALATAWVRVEQGVPKDEAKAAMYTTIRSSLRLAQSTAQRRMDDREVKEIARGFINPDVTDSERAEFWSQFPDLTEADRVAICERIKRRRGSR